MISIVCSKGNFMKKLAILIIVFSNLVFAQDYADVTARVVVRDHKFRAKVQEVVLPYLTSVEKSSSVYLVESLDTLFVE
jgi:hypothetical protein